MQGGDLTAKLHRPLGILAFVYQYIKMATT